MVQKSPRIFRKKLNCVASWWGLEGTKVMAVTIFFCVEPSPCPPQHNLQEQVGAKSKSSLTWVNSGVGHYTTVHLQWSWTVLIPRQPEVQPQVCQYLIHKNKPMEEVKMRKQSNVSNERTDKTTEKELNEIVASNKVKSSKHKIQISYIKMV